MGGVLGRDYRAEAVPARAADVGGNDVAEQGERALVDAHDQPTVRVLRQVDGHPAPGRADVAGPAVGVPDVKRSLVAPELAPVGHEVKRAIGIADLEQV